MPKSPPLSDLVDHLRGYIRETRPRGNPDEFINEQLVELFNDLDVSDYPEREIEAFQLSFFQMLGEERLKRGYLTAQQMLWYNGLEATSPEALARIQRQLEAISTRLGYSVIREGPPSRDPSEN